MSRPDSVRQTESEQEKGKRERERQMGAEVGANTANVTYEKCRYVQLKG